MTRQRKFALASSIFYGATWSALGRRTRTWPGSGSLRTPHAGI